MVHIGAGSLRNAVSVQLMDKMDLSYSILHDGSNIKTTLALFVIIQI